MYLHIMKIHTQTLSYILQDSEAEAASERCSTWFDHKESEKVNQEEKVAATLCVLCF